MAAAAVQATCRHFQNLIQQAMAAVAQRVQEAPWTDQRFQQQARFQQAPPPMSSSV